MNAEDTQADDFDDEDPDYTPRIAVLGAGPIGLEAALYGRYLGYDVAVFEKGTVANNVRRWEHVKMFSPFAANRSALGVAAMQAHYEDLCLPDDNALLSGGEYVEAYLAPLAKTDLLAGCVHEHVEVQRVARDGIIKTDTENLDRSDFTFRVLLRTSEGEDVVEADYVIDTTGVFDQPTALGHGGLPAIGELDLATSPSIFRHVPDVLGSERSYFENKRVLVVGNGYSAATCIVALKALQQQAAETQTTWVVRREAESDGPLPVQEADPLSERRQLVQAANAAVRDAAAGIVLADQTSVLELSRNSDESFLVTLGGKLSGQYNFDTIVALTGYRPDTAVFSELQIELCKATEATRAMGKWMTNLGAIDAVEQTLPGADVLQTGEAQFFILGSKSFGRNSNFLLSLGLEQIRAAFAVIADRENLDLYGTMANLSQP